MIKTKLPNLPRGCSIPIPTRSLLEIATEQKQAEHVVKSTEAVDKTSCKIKDRAARKAKRLNKEGEKLIEYAQGGTISDPHIIRLI